jgi:hypothetical protein
MVTVKFWCYYVLVGDKEDVVTVCDYVYLKCYYNSLQNPNTA